MKQELISIIIPTYNRLDVLSSISVPSVIKQTHDNWELIIVDDGSTDNTKEFCNELMTLNSRIKYVYKENGGQGSARNIGIKSAKGEYVLLLDSDDALLPKMVEIMLGRIIGNSCDIVRCKKWDYNFQKGFINLSDDNPSCVIYRKRLFEKFCYYSEDRKLIGIEDADLSISWHKLEKEIGYELKDIKYHEPLVIYLTHENQATSDSDLPRKKGMVNSLIEKYSNDNKVDSEEMYIKYRELGNIKLILKDVTGKNELKKSLSIKFNLESVMLLFISYLGLRMYPLSISMIKKIRERIIWRIKLKRGIKNYPLLYREALKMTKNK